jgi:hypothetical protein
LIQFKGSGALSGFLDTTVNQNNTVLFETIRTYHINEMLRHVFGCWIEIEQHNTVGVHCFELFAKWIVNPNQKLMIPIFFKPVTEGGFNHTEVDNSTEIIQFVGDTRKVYPVVVPVKVSAFVLVPHYPVPGAKIVIPFDLIHVGTPREDAVYIS